MLACSLILGGGANSVYAQTPCESAIFVPNSACTTDTTYMQEMWYSFNSGMGQDMVEISLTSSEFIPQEIQSIELYSGTCESLVLIATGDRNQHQILLQATISGGVSYFVRLLRDSTTQIAYDLCINTSSSTIVCPPCPVGNCQLVCNPTMESIVSIPVGVAQMKSCAWRKPCVTSVCGTPDHFNSAITTPNSNGIPLNFQGAQAAHSGNNYLGIYCYYNQTTNYREYVQTQLTSPLVAGVSYQISFWVSLGNYSSYAIGSIGASLSQTQPIQTATNNVFTQFPPQVTCTAVVTNTQGWTLVTGSFTPSSSGYQWLTLGCFETDATLFATNNIVNVPSSGNPAPYYPGYGSYYFIDDVTVRPDSGIAVSFNPNPPCYHDSMLFTATSTLSNGIYTWTGFPTPYNCLNAGCDSLAYYVNAFGLQTIEVSTFLPSLGCFDTATVYPYFLTGPPDAQAGPDTAICPGSWVTLQGTIPFFTDTIWWTDSGGNFICGGCLAITNNPANNTFYVFHTGFQATGCTKSDTVFVTMLPPPDASILGVSSGCDTAAAYCPATQTAGATYLWQVWNVGYTTQLPYTTSAANCIVVNWQTASNFSGGHVVLTVTYGGTCVASDTFEVSACCINPNNGAFLYNATISTLLGPGPHLRNGVNLYINGTLTVDEDLHFATSTLNMGANAKIVVTGGHTLRLEETAVRSGCCDMWDAIEGTNVTDSIIVYRTSYIGDAERGIVSNNGAVYRVYDNVTFNRNLVSITVNPYSGNHGGKVQEALFTSVSMAYCPSNNGVLLAPYANQWPLFGIATDSVNNITFGNSANIALRNTFTNLRHGIRTVNTNSNIYNNSFISVNKAGSSSKAVWARGRYISFGPVNFTQYTVRVGGATIGQVQKNTFLNCPNGVYTDTAMNTYVRNNTFTQVLAQNQLTLTGTAIRVNNCSGPNVIVDIINDSIVNHSYGYYASNNNNCTTRVWGNTIRRTHPGDFGCTGVFMSTTNGFNNGTTSIYLNTMRGVQTGIRLLNFRNASLDNNFIHVRPTLLAILPARGIWIDNSLNTSITENLIYKEYPVNPATTNQWVGGIYVSNSNNSKVTCNKIYSLGYGIRISGPSMTTATVFNNTMNNTRTGIWLSNGAIVGAQGSATVPSDNKWTGSVVTRLYTSNSTFGNLSPFRYRPVPPNNNQFLPIPTISAFASSPIQPAPTSVTNPPLTICLYIQPPPTNGGGTMQQIAQGQIAYPSNQSAGQWLGREGVYRMLLDDSTLAGNNQALVVFKDSSDQSNVGIISNTLKLQSRQALNQSNLMVNANAAINSLIPANTVEHHMQTVQSILTGHTLSGDTLTSVELDTLRAIAVLCPYTDGNAVYLARAILLDYDTTFYQNPCEEEEPVSLRLNGNDEPMDSGFTFELFPNPNDGEFSVRSSISETQTGELIILSIAGQPVKTIRLIPGGETQVINIEELPSGTYFYQVKVNGEIKKTDRIIIIN